ncbi:nuclear transport factor 2 family protein [Longispora sp. K20-0274]|uniref:nuclear transport factor 2 family protein n=1 Tax=Longispora sp. K20-0274 TaxID=3088255 RepID=UPI00399A72B6
MGEQENRRILERLFGGDGIVALSAEEEYAARAEDFVMDMPQSGERIMGRDAMRKMQEAYPAPPSIRVRRIIGDGDLFVMEAVSDYGGDIYHVSNIVEFRDGRIIRETRYYAAPFPAPEWRSRWVGTAPGLVDSLICEDLGPPGRMSSCRKLSRPSSVVMWSRSPAGVTRRSRR